MIFLATESQHFHWETQKSNPKNCCEKKNLQTKSNDHKRVDPPNVKERERERESERERETKT